MVFYAPHYLVYTESKLRSDGIILLLNPDLEASKKEVYRLITVLYSSHLIIPVYGKVLKARDSGALPPMKRRPSIQYSSTRKKKDKHNYRVYEDTDMEVMHAKAMMVRFGFKSADVDFYHCSEYIHELADAQYCKGTRKAQEWVEATFVRLFHNQVTGVIRGINRMKPTSPEAKKKIKDVVRYLSNHREKVDYGAAKRGGYHIGSGAIESANKFIAHVRLKRSGAWWYISNANNILKLRCAKYNGTYDRIIQKYKKLDREKVYAKFNLANSM